MYRIRAIRPDEAAVLDTFLYEAIFVPEGADPPPRSILETEELQMYVRNFGEEKDDHGFVAETEGRIVGAVWVRVMPDYGHVDAETPSLSISLLPEYRGMGIGTALMKRMLEALKELGYARVSLSVWRANPAARLYRRLGFVTVQSNQDDDIMICEL